jgi:DNA polymerase V
MSTCQPCWRHLKKRPQSRGVCDLRSPEVRAELLATVPVDEVWGIGGASAAKLGKIGGAMAADLAALQPDDARALSQGKIERRV